LFSVPVPVVADQPAPRPAWGNREPLRAMDGPATRYVDLLPVLPLRHRRNRAGDVAGAFGHLVAAGPKLLRSGAERSLDALLLRSFSVLTPSDDSITRRDKHGEDHQPVGRRADSSGLLHSEISTASVFELLCQSACLRNGLSF